MLYSHKALRTVPGTSCVLSDENGGGRCGKEEREVIEEMKEKEEDEQRKEAGGGRKEHKTGVCKAPPRVTERDIKTIMC